MENALKKAREIAEISGAAALADDSGICAHALDGAPGIYSARYAGEDGGHGDDEANNDLLLKNLEDKADRTAHYTCAMALCYPDGSEVTAEGYMYGTVITERRGDRGFGYDPLFVPVGESRTVAEMSDEEKNAISHRANALKNLLEKL
jgi:XTP/dITP diphosphohydrolase